jgi:fatty-acid desaturase
MLDAEVYEARCSNRQNAGDLSKQPFYRHMQNQYIWHITAHYTLIYALGGWAGLCWRALATSVLYHVTWFVNSAAHFWGKQEYATGDQSRNNWWVGFLAFGEGWHNNHHAFEYSARHVSAMASERP